MERYKDMKPRVDALEALKNATPAGDRRANGEIVVEAMKLYQLCKTKYMHWHGRAAGSMVGFGVGAAGAVATAGISAVAAYGLCVRNCTKSDAWKLLKDKCKEIGEAAAENSDLEFTRTSEGAMTFLRPFMMAGGDEMACSFS